MPEFFKAGRVSGFDGPTATPRTETEKRDWQAANAGWWNEHPMEYDWDGDESHPAGSAEFFDGVDRRFFAAAETFLSSRTGVPFDELIPFENLKGADVLEIGVGAGSHAELLASHAASFTGIDLTEHAVELTTRRFTVRGLKGRVLRMDAETLDFSDDSFDFIWSWGVIHHSADTPAILAEMHRVLRPGGRAVVMVYNRSFWWYYVVSGLVRGVFLGDLLKTRSLHRTVQNGIDGAMARFYSQPEWRELGEAVGLRVEWIKVYGDKPQLVPIPAGRLKSRLLARIPNAASRLFLNRMRQGYFLVASHLK